jgi:hypothetical protein
MALEFNHGRREHDETPPDNREILPWLSPAGSPLYNALIWPPSRPASRSPPRPPPRNSSTCGTGQGEVADLRGFGINPDGSYNMWFG